MTSLDSSLALDEVEEAPLLSTEGEEMGHQAAPPALDLPAWYTPKRLLVLFCCMQLLVYMDRGCAARRTPCAACCAAALSCCAAALLRAPPHASRLASSIISSTGVKGTKASPGHPGSGMAGRFGMSEVQDGFVFRRVPVQRRPSFPHPRERHSGAVLPASLLALSRAAQPDSRAAPATAPSWWACSSAAP